MDIAVLRKRWDELTPVHAFENRFIICPRSEFFSVPASSPVPLGRGLNYFEVEKPWNFGEFQKLEWSELSSRVETGLCTSEPVNPCG